MISSIPKALIVLTLALTIIGCDTQKTQTSLPEMNYEDYRVLGNRDASVTFIEFSDYECPFCKKFTNEILPQIQEKYIDTGKVKFVFRDYTLEIHDHAKQAAIAASCAGKQGKYYEYHDLLFEKSKEITEENIDLWAQEMGLDMELFATCINAPESHAKLESDLAEARSVGAIGTPSFLINEHFLTGAQPFAVFEQLIEAELNQTPPPAPTASTEATCYTDADCREPMTLGPYCSQTNPDEVCITTGTPTCKLPGTTESACVTIIVEECNACDSGTTCSDGACVSPEVE